MMSKRFFVISLIVFGLLLNGFNFVVRADESWYDSDYGYKKKLTIDHDQVGSTLTNFPVLVNITDDSDLFNHVTNDSGFDLLFVNGAEDIQFAHEIEYWNWDTGNSEVDAYIWVNVTSVAHDVNTDFYMYYGKSGAGNQENIVGTWDSNYMMVQHFTGASATDLDDSTSNDCDVISDTGSPSYNSEGLVGKAVDIAPSDYITIGDNDALSFGDASDDGSFTIGIWLKPEGLTDFCALCKGSSTNREYVLYFDFGNSNTIRCYDSVLTNNIGRWSYDFPPVDTWTYVVVTYTGNEATSGFSWYMDSSYDAGSATDSGSYVAMHNQVEDFTIGRWFSETGTTDGLIDDLRMSNIVRSSDWISASYNNVINSYDGGFITWGVEETPPPPPPPPPSLIIANPYPENNSVDICPCIDYMSIAIATNGTAMNLSFYHSIGDTSDFHLMEKYYNLINGTYSFCMCGHSFVPAYISQYTNDDYTIASAGAWYDVSFTSESDNIKNINHTWYDANNNTFTVLYDGIYQLAYRISFEDTAVAPTSEAYGRLVVNNIEVAGTLQMKGMLNKNEIASVSSHIMKQLYVGDQIKLQFTGDSTTIKLTSHTTYGDIPTSAILSINRIDDADQHPIHYNETYYWYVNLLEYGNPSNYNVSDIYKFTTVVDASDCDITEGLTESEADKLFLSSTLKFDYTSMLFIFWMFLIVIGEWKRDMIYKVLQIPLGVFYGVTLLDSDMWLGLIMICVSIYLGATSLWQYRKE